VSHPSNRDRRNAESSNPRHSGKEREPAHSAHGGDPEARLPPEFATAVQFTNYERNWIRTHLGAFHEKELILDVVRRVKAGKEATVYACTGHPSTGRAVVAAKLYREQSLRGSKNTAQYQEGRALLEDDGDDTSQRSRRPGKGGARKTKSAGAASASQTSWLMHELTVLQALHAQGGDVPKPFEHAEQALLMEFIGEGTEGAPTLNDIVLEPSEAKQLFERVVFNIELLLGLGWVHGDLSAYNILYHQGRIVLIDFPQVVHCRNNPKARSLFDRDVQRVAEYFSTHDASIDHEQLARQLWEKHIPDAGTAD
jgi:RIO kinase 1